MGTTHSIRTMGARALFLVRLSSRHGEHCLVGLG